MLSKSSGGHVDSSVEGIIHVQPVINTEHVLLKKSKTRWFFTVAIFFFFFFYM